MVASLLTTIRVLILHDWQTRNNLPLLTAYQNFSPHHRQRQPLPARPLLVGARSTVQHTVLGAIRVLRATGLPNTRRQSQNEMIVQRKTSQGRAQQRNYISQAAAPRPLIPSRGTLFP